MSALSDFSKCVDEINESGRVTINCKLGLWSVSCSSSDRVYLEAFHYWKQYAKDGEYSSIIGGKSVVEKLIDKQQ